MSESRTRYIKLSGLPEVVRGRNSPAGRVIIATDKPPVPAPRAPLRTNHVSSQRVASNVTHSNGTHSNFTSNKTATSIYSNRPILDQPESSKPTQVRAQYLHTPVTKPKYTSTATSMTRPERRNVVSPAHSCHNTDVHRPPIASPAPSTQSLHRRSRTQPKTRDLCVTREEFQEFVSDLTEQLAQIKQQFDMHSRRPAISPHPQPQPHTHSYPHLYPHPYLHQSEELDARPAMSMQRAPSAFVDPDISIASLEYLNRKKII